MARQARHAGVVALAEALQAARADTLATFAAYEAALPALQVPCHESLNPPLWELGHVGWFQSWWLLRFDDWRAGVRADPLRARAPEWRAGADAMYDSSTVAHERRWALPLPDAQATRDDLAGQLEAVLQQLARVDDGGAQREAQLYFFRLALLHEDMHHEAALYMAQTLGLAVHDPRWQPQPLAAEAGVLPVPAARVVLGRASDEPGFAFDNEVGEHDVQVQAFEIDRQAVRWCEFLPFVEEGGYEDERWWSAPGWAWRAQQGLQAPRVLRRRARASGAWGWERQLYGRWQPLHPDEAACHLSAHEAQAWCRWAGRQLPTEAQWVHAVRTHGAALRWGDVWEWTASAFEPFAGFTPHPYRDYSQPWFDGRPVLKGASFMTQPRMKHAAYRNYFGAHRSDVPAGFRSCSI